MKKVVALAFLALSFNSYSQNGKIYFLKNDGRFVTNKDSADFMRIVDEPDSGSVYYKITEFYPNSAKKLIATASVYWPKVIWEGPSISYDKQGRKVKQIIYKNNSPAGSAYFYYPNGRVMKELNYTDTKINSSAKGKIALKYTLVSYFDSTGVQLVKDGNGYLKEFHDKSVAEEGNYVDGVRHGVWKGTIAEEGISFEEKYDKGTFLSGKSVEPDGKVTLYTIKDVLPQFPGGEKAFGQFLSSNIKYPPEARNWGMSGRVVLSYTVEKDGSLTDIQTVSAPHYALEEEAIRVLKKSPKWKPAIKNGIPVKVRYTLPITFSISGSVPRPAEVIKF